MRRGGRGDDARRSPGSDMDGVRRPIPSWVRREERSARSEVARWTRRTSERVERDVTASAGERVGSDVKRGRSVVAWRAGGWYGGQDTFSVS